LDNKWAVFSQADEMIILDPTSIFQIGFALNLAPKGGYHDAKCFQASDVAKWFIKDACERNLFAAPRTLSTRSETRTMLN
jgi:hypothetical protein